MYFPPKFNAVILGKSLQTVGMDTGLTGVCSDFVIKSSVVVVH